jgi:endonuclease YncB( thermonuclease family)
MKSLLISLVFVALVTVPAISSTITGKVVGVSDGDTIKIVSAGKQIKIRLYGIDTPEKKQAFGQSATRAIKSLLSSSVTVKEKDVDRYGRTVGIVYSAAGTNINREMVKNGYAWVYKKYCRESFCYDWLDLEDTARNEMLGLWSQNAVPPWEYRKRKSTK